jgi:hypothetical protein
MALKYLNESEAEKLCAGTLEQWIGSSNYQGCHSADETREAVEEAKLWAAKSATAREIMATVETSSKEILVVGMRGGYQCFDSTGTDQMTKVPVVYIDLDGRLKRFVRQPHQLHFAPEDCAKQSVSLENMDNKVALLHEFGHAKQWLENPMAFDNHFMGQKGSAPGKNLSVQRTIPGSEDPLLHPEGRKGPVKVGLKGGGNAGQSFAQAIQARAAEVWGKKGNPYDPLLNPKGGFSVSEGDRRGDWLLTAQDLEQFKPISGYSVRIESDNMARHEWPICDELGLPRRRNYRDIQGTSTPKASQTSILLKRKAEQDVVKAPVKVGSLGGKVACPKCRKLVSARGLQQACGTLLHA